MNIVNISLSVLSVEKFSIPGEQPFTVCQALYSQPNKDGTLTDHLVIVKAFNNQWDKSTTASINADRLALFKKGMKMLVNGTYWSELKDRVTREVIEFPYIEAHSLAPIKEEVSYNNVYIAGRLITMPTKFTYDEKTKVEGCLRIDSAKNKSHLYNFIAWNKTGDTISRFVRKNENLGLEGKLEFQTWNDKTTGELKTAIKIRASKVTLMGTLDAKNEEPTF